VDAEVCRSLGIRSILVYPVIKLRSLHQEESLGVIELFSPLPNAFDDPAIHILQHLSQRIVENVDLAAKAAISSAGESGEQSPEIAPPPGFAFKETSSNPRFANHWTAALNAVVIALALVVGWMIGYAGWRPAGSVHHSRSGTVDQPSQGLPVQALGTAPMSATQSTVPSRVAGETHPTSTARDAKPKAATDSLGDTLVVYKNGRVVFRTSPTNAGTVVAAGAAANPPLEVSPSIANGYLTSRIEPDYPEQARAQQIQGAVVLDALVDQNGVVKELKTISGDPLLVTPASAAVRQWRFKPFFRNGQPSEFQTRITVDFRLP
jgi:TonB family protein